PHLNAAESLFSYVKTYVKKQDIRRDTLSGHILNGLNQVSREKAAAQIEVEDPYEEESDMEEDVMEVDEGGEEDAEDGEEVNDEDGVEDVADHFE
ncbi:hypothetical protein BG006_004083, partial [Podila minutissima]